MTGRKVYVVGVGMTSFTKPKKDPSEGPHFPELGKQAVERALRDGCLEAKDVQFAATGCMFAIGAGQRVLYDCGIYDVPVMNVNNACATGSNALYLARNAVKYGQAECALALGVEKMAPGSLGGGGAKGGATSLDHHYRVMHQTVGIAKAPPMPQFFGNAGEEYMKKYPECKDEHFAMIGQINHKHSVNNPYSQFRDEYSLEDVMKAPKVYKMLTKLQCSPTSDGAACAIVASEEFVVKHGLQGQAIELAAMSFRTDASTVFNGSAIELIGAEMCKRGAADVFKESGLTPNDVNVVELHDCFSANEMITIEGLGLCKPGEAYKLVENGDITYGGKYVINPSGGLISKGHPLGATGIAQCCELSWQLRGECGPRQVKNAKVGLQHNLGLGGACNVAMYVKPSQWEGAAPKRQQSLAMGAPQGSKL